MLENVGSNPTILTDLYCPVAQRWCGWLLTRRVQVRVLPGQLDTEGRANRHDGTRLEAGRGASPCRFESCPFRCSTRACSWESSQAPTLTQRVRLLPSLLVCPWPSSPGTDLPRRIGGCDSRRTLFLLP